MPTESPTSPASPDHHAEPDRQRAHVLAARAAHWTRTRRLTALLLALWLATGFCTVFFARDLAHLSVFGWPLSFYLAAQGASLTYLAIIGVYAWRMRILDRAFARQLEEAA
jgi:putative solute:sodium symporter small subunit